MQEMSEAQKSFSSNTHTRTHLHTLGAEIHFYLRTQHMINSTVKKKKSTPALRAGVDLISFNLAYRLWRGSQATDGNGPKEKGVCQREKQHQKQHQPHQIEEE